MSDWRIRYVKTSIFGYQFRAEKLQHAFFGLIPYWSGKGLCDSLERARAFITYQNAKDSGAQYKVGTVWEPTP